MQKFFVYGIIILVLISSMSWVNAEEEIQSTEGITLEEGISKTVSTPDKEYKKEIKQGKKAKNKYLKNISHIKKMRERKRIKQRDLEFLQKRLEVQKYKLEELTSDVKGEEE